jgi:hypothetical protein
MSLPLSEDRADLVEAWTEQPELFSRLDVDVPVVRAARDFIHSGKTTTRQSELCALIIGATALGWSYRKIAAEYHVSRNTVKAVVQVAEKSGKVEPVRERVLAAVAESALADVELGNQVADVIRRKLVEGDGADRLLSGLASLRRATGGIAAEMMGQTLPAGIGPAVTVNVTGPGSSVQVVEEYAGRLARLQNQAAARPGRDQVVQIPTLEIESGDNTANPAGTRPEPEAHVKSHVEPPSPAAQEPAPNINPAAPDRPPGPMPDRVTPTGAGGGANAPALPESRSKSEGELQ